MRHDGDLLRHPRRALAGALVTLAILAILTLVVATTPQVVDALDGRWRGWILGTAAPLRRLGLALESVGSAFVMVPLRLGVGAWLAWRRRWWDLTAWVAGWAVADLLTAIAKPSIGRLRPPGAEGVDPLRSFPSAHAKSAAQVAVGLVLVVTDPRRSRGAAYAVAVVWIALMALSRTIVDDHWLSDVVAGGLLGAAVAVGAAACAQLARNRRAGLSEPLGTGP
jgi:membrane-associated phospholipid phosphatase